MRGPLAAGAAVLAAFAIVCTSDEAPPPTTATPPDAAIASSAAASPTPAAADPTIAEPPRASATPAASPVTVSAADDWEHRVMVRGDSLDAEHGMLFVDAASGDSELWAVNGSAPSFGYSSSPGGRFVLARSVLIRLGSEELLADRESGVTYRWGSVR